MIVGGQMEDKSPKTRKCMLISDQAIMDLTREFDTKENHSVPHFHCYCSSICVSGDIKLAR
jgi:hypothetical protein